MSPDSLQNVVFPIAAFLIGAWAGSLLNTIIYRVPLGLSIGNPKGSICPKCKCPIPARHNIPQLSWLLLGGKCGSCGKAISPRYFVVEVLTATLFLISWLVFSGSGNAEGGEWAGWSGIGMTLSIWVLLALLLAAAFIDIDHFIIPDSISLGGLGAGLIASLVFPALHGVESHWQGLALACLGAATGFGLLWVIVKLGKAIFGQIHHVFEEPADWSISQPDPDESPVIRLGDEELDWDEVFFREKDRLIIEVTEVEVNGEKIGTGEVVIQDGEVRAGDRLFPLEQTKSIFGKCIRVTIPREAMGFGDVKLVAMIGAFLGWKAVLFTVFAASIIGAMNGIFLRSVARERWSRPLPFGPFLSIGAVLWIFAGARILEWCGSLAGP